MIAPQHEDFGMALLEANACGRPVIALGCGGATETVIDGTTGILVQQQTVDAFVAAIERFERMTFEPHVVRRHAETFGKDLFMRDFENLVYAAHEQSMLQVQLPLSPIAVKAGV